MRHSVCQTSGLDEAQNTATHSEWLNISGRTTLLWQMLCEVFNFMLNMPFDFSTFREMLCMIINYTDINTELCPVLIGWNLDCSCELKVLACIPS